MGGAGAGWEGTKLFGVNTGALADIGVKAFAFGFNFEVRGRRVGAVVDEPDAEDAEPDAGAPDAGVVEVVAVGVVVEGDGEVAAGLAASDGADEVGWTWPGEEGAEP
jgi:hypothetical protein